MSNNQPGNLAFRFSGEAAENYDRYLGPILFDCSAEALLKRLKLLPNQFILEIAAGTGRVTKPLADALPPGAKLVATDISPDMLEVSKNKLTRSQVEFLVADAQQLPFGDNVFDQVICQYGVMFLPDRQKGFSEAYRVLKPGGRYFFSTWESTTKIPLFRIFFDEGILPFFKGEDTSRYVLPWSLHDPEMLKTWLLQAGFRNPQVERVEMEVMVSSVTVLIDGLLLKHSLGTEVSDKDPSALQPLAKKIEEGLTREFGEGPFKIKLYAYFSTGEK